MKKKELLDLLENENLELKKAKNSVPNSFWETYSSFANTDGGIVIFGVDETNHEITGVEDPYKIRGDLFNTLNNPKKVSVNLLSNDNIKIMPADDTHVIIIEIPEAPYSQKPVYLKGNLNLSYERLGEGDHKLTPEKLKALIVGSHEITDNELLKNFDLTDLNEDDLASYKKALWEQSKYDKYKDISNREMLIEIGAMRKDRDGDGEYYLTSGALLFFGKYNSIIDRFPGFQLEYMEKASSIETDWLDRVSSGGSAYPDLNLYSFFKIVSGKFDLSIKEEFYLDKTSMHRLPFKADLLISVREALVNSLMHADYDSNGTIKVSVYPDYYEFSNPGKMRITEEEFIHGGNSNIRNLVISGILRKIGIAEKAGSGGPRIYDIAQKYNLKYPEINRAQDKTEIRIWKVDLEKTFANFPENEQLILYYLIKNQTISRKEAKNELAISDYQFRLSIDSLIDKKMLEVIGRGPSTKYMLKPSSSESYLSIKNMMRKFLDVMNRDLQ